MECHFPFFLLLVIVCLFSTSECGKGGKTAAKVGLVGISQVGSSGGVQGRESDVTFGGARSDSNTSKASDTVMARLKYDLLVKQGYDKAVRPVLNHTDQVLVDIDFTYIQTLNLNEKDQTLKSLLRYRVYWKDQFLVWDPADYDGVSDIRLPSNMLWVPDIVLYEEVGLADYNPRLPYAEIRYDGTVRYLEPLSLETTCSINIAHFPFDFQVCTLTFVSWTFPTSRLDIKSRRSRSDLQKDIPIYFIKSGEWVLDDVNITKLSQDFAAVLQSNDELGVDEFKKQQFFYMDPQKSVAEVADNRLTEMHWSEVQFKLMFRRNSSLYMQSMLFPALLLTTISLLGFYLPPDSGERIGLQITIMLTFMVFLLTVGDMFPASTGPFLGVYFVLCMALLGVNIVMTVVVLHLHHMPCAAVLQGPDENMEYGIDLSPVPYWIRFFLIISGVSEELRNFKLTEDDMKGDECFTQKNTGILSTTIVPIWNKCKTIFRSSSLSSIPSKSPRMDVEVGHGAVCGGRKLEPLAVVNREGDYLSMEREKLRHRSRKTSREILPGSTNPDECKEQNHCRTPLLSNGNHRHDRAVDVMQNDVTTLRNDVSAATGYLRFQNDELKDSKRCDAMEEKWKDVARRIDVLCMKIYIFLLFVFHVAILIAIFVDL